MLILTPKVKTTQMSVANAIDMLRDTGQEKLANDLEDIASDFAEARR